MATVGERLLCTIDILAEQDVISRELAERLLAVVGFRNRVIYEYEKLNLDIVYKVWQERLRISRSLHLCL